MSRRRRFVSLIGAISARPIAHTCPKREDLDQHRALETECHTKRHGHQQLPPVKTRGEP